MCNTGNNGKSGAIFNLEGYDESYEFKIFGEEYLKFRHFLIQNNFTYESFSQEAGQHQVEVEG
jgi:DNA polymerase-3 subunit alpha